MSRRTRPHIGTEEAITLAIHVLEPRLGLFDKDPQPYRRTLMLFCGGLRLADSDAPPPWNEDSIARLIDGAERDPDAAAAARMIAADMLEDGMLPPEALRRYVARVLPGLVHPSSKSGHGLMLRDHSIAFAVYCVAEKGFPEKRRSTERTSWPPTSACAVVAVALERLKHAMSESNVEAIWDTRKHMR